MQTNNKLRDALELCDKIMSDVVVGTRDISPLDAFDEMGRIIDKALAAPPRNCDVGTVEEQMKRQHDTMCNTTKACPDSDWSCKKCFAEWSQMPYEKGEAE